jgi:hypothetical protein
VRRHLRKLSRLPSTEQWLLLKTVLLLETMRLGMRWLPFRSLRRLLEAAEAVPPAPRRSQRLPAPTIARTIRLASRNTPGLKTCLAQALAGRLLLVRHGHPAVLRIGVAGGEQFKAHAWVECEGKVLIGGHELDRYTPLLALGVEAK